MQKKEGTIIAATRSEAVQGQLTYLDEKEFPRLKEARAADFFDNSFAETLRKAGLLPAPAQIK